MDSPLFRSGIQYSNEDPDNVYQFKMVKKNKNNKNKSGNGNRKRKQPQQQQQRTRTVYRDPPKPKNSFLGDLGAFAGNAVSKFFGMGAYELNQNSLMDKTGRQVPFMHSTDETVIIRHREYIGEINSSSEFSLSRYSVNPGLDNIFPYLSALAQNFEQYEFRGLVFEFNSTSAVALNSTNTALGAVMMAAQYRADADPFTSKMEVQNHFWSVSGKPSDSFFLPVECDPAENPYKIQYVRTGSIPSNQDVKLYDLCNVSVATYGSQAVAVVGELWATYEVALRKPKLASLKGVTTDTFEATMSGAPSGFMFSGTNTIQIDNIGVQLLPSAVVFSGQAGVFLCCINLIASGTMATGFLNPTLIADAEFVPFNGQNSIRTNGATSATMLFQFRIKDPAKSVNIGFGGPNWSGTVAGEIVITQVAAA